MQVHTLPELVSLAERIGIRALGDQQTTYHRIVPLELARALFLACMGCRRTGQVMSINQNQVLVVDDDVGMLRAIKPFFQQNDYEPTLFSSAQVFKSHAGTGG